MQYVKLNEDTPDLKYAKQGDAGLDLSLVDTIVLDPQEARIAGTGVCVKVPEGNFGLVVPRSSTGKLGIMLANTVGIIDSGYTGEIKLFLRNLLQDIVVLEAGSRVAQLILLPFSNVIPERVLVLPETERSSGGFGSTGK